jgi:hypothetical protein
MIKFLSVSVFRLSVLYVVLVLLSFVTSLLLPSFHDVALMRTESCYWTSAMLAFVECGQDVIAGSAKSFGSIRNSVYELQPMRVCWVTC